MKAALQLLCTEIVNVSSYDFLQAADSELHLEHFFGEGKCVKVYFDQTLALNKIYAPLLQPLRSDTFELHHIKS